MDYAVYMDTICHGVVYPWKLYPIDENDIHMDERGNFVMADVFLRITGDQLYGIRVIQLFCPGGRVDSHTFPGVNLEVRHIHK